MELHNLNCSLCALECELFDENYIDYSCFRNNSITKCFCCENQLNENNIDNNCVSLNSNCSNCYNACQKINLIDIYCKEIYDINIETALNECYCCSKNNNNKITTDLIPIRTTIKLTTTDIIPIKTTIDLISSIKLISRKQM